MSFLLLLHLLSLVLSVNLIKDIGLVHLMQIQSYLLMLHVLGGDPVLLIQAFATMLRFVSRLCESRWFKFVYNLIPTECKSWTPKGRSIYFVSLCFRTMHALQCLCSGYFCKTYFYWQNCKRLTSFSPLVFFSNLSVPFMSVLSVVVLNRSLLA